MRMHIHLYTPKCLYIIYIIIVRAHRLNGGLYVHAARFRSKHRNYILKLYRCVRYYSAQCDVFPCVRAFPAYKVYGKRKFSTRLFREQTPKCVTHDV